MSDLTKMNDDLESVSRNLDRIIAARDALLQREAELNEELQESYAAQIKNHHAYLNILHDKNIYKEERDTLKAENEKSHKAFDSLEESFLKTSNMLNEACMKNKSLYEQFNLWKEERDTLRKEVERLNGVNERLRVAMNYVKNNGCGLENKSFLEQAIISSEGREGRG